MNQSYANRDDTDIEVRLFRSVEALPDFQIYPKTLNKETRRLNEQNHKIHRKK